MGTFWDKQPSSRIILAQNLNWTGTGTLVSTTFSKQTFQVRVIAQTAGWINIDATGNSSTPTTAGGIGVFIPASTIGGEYFTVTPGQILSYSSTTTSTASPLVNVTEMA